MNVERSYCRICIANCGILVSIEGERVVEVKGDPDHPISKGYVCPKGRALGTSHHGDRRLDGAYIGRGDERRHVTVPEAISDLGGKLRGIVAEHGPGSIGFFMGSGGFVDPAGGFVLRRLAAALGTKHFYSTGTVDSVAKTLVTALMGGTTALIPHPDEEGKLMVLVGSNPPVSHGQSTGFPNPIEKLRGVKRRGELIVIDPRETESAKLADRHLLVRPGTDHIVLAHAVREILADGADMADLRRRAVNVDELIAAVEPYDAATTETLTGIDAESLAAFVNSIRAAGRLAVVTGTGTTMSPGGNLVEWMAWALMIATGSFDQPGGMWFNPGYFTRIDRREKLPTVRLDEVGPPSRPDTIRLMGEWPAACIPEEIEARRIKALIVAGANAAIALPDTLRVAAALSSVEVLVNLDVDNTETGDMATHAIGCADQLERADLLALEMFAGNLYNQYTPALLPRVEGRPAMWHTLALIAQELGLDVLDGADPATVTDDDILFRVARRGDLEGLKAAGGPVITAPAVYGWAEDRLPNGVWDIAPVQMVEQLAQWQPRTQLVVTPRRQLRHQNSQPYRDGDQAVALIHPRDAERHGVVDGDTVTITSEVGSVRLPAKVTDQVVEGSVSFPHGWNDANVNLLTSTTDMDPLSGMPVMSGTPVSLVVEPALVAS
ncbi:MAG: molybdopterin-dependent oxidoreductase [Acidimicrobiia bacterium]